MSSTAIAASSEAAAADWRTAAACAGKPTAWWFAHGQRDGFVAELALALCRRCPVRADCLAAAELEESTAADTFGIRGGLTADERNRRRRGRRFGATG